MNLRVVILAFLAARSPASYSAPAIHSRVSRCGLLDSAPTIDDVYAELQTLASPAMGGLADIDIHPVTKAASMRATDAGVRRWTLDGRISVGG